jgi:hypothetical protein
VAANVTRKVENQYSAENGKKVREFPGLELFMRENAF